MSEHPPSETSDILKVGDCAWTNYHGKDQYVRIVERIGTPNSQSGYSFKVQALGGGRMMPSVYDAAWFWKGNR